LSSTRCGVILDFFLPWIRCLVVSPLCFMVKVLSFTFFGKLLNLELILNY
jgi:hypothetical protein